MNNSTKVMYFNMFKRWAESPISDRELGCKVRMFFERVSRNMEKAGKAIQYFIRIY